MHPVVSFLRGGAGGLLLLAVLGSAALVVRPPAGPERLVAPEPAGLADRDRAAIAVALDRTGDRLEVLADRVAALPVARVERAFHDLAVLRPGALPEIALAILDSTGRPVVWAGRHLVVPGAEGRPMRFSATPYYGVLEVRRQRTDGGHAVASALLWADRAVPGDPGSLASVHRERTGIGFRPLAPDPVASMSWPAADPVLSVTADQLRDGTRGSGDGGSAALIAALVVAALVGLTIVAKGGRRFLALAVLLAVGLLTPVPQALGLSALFSSTTFFSRVLGPFSASAGAAILTGGVALAGAVWVWNHPGPPRVRRLVITAAALLLIGTPYLVRELGRGITPPAEGVSLGLWWTWHLAILLPAVAMLVAAAALLKPRLGSREGSRGDRGGMVAVVAGVAGLVAAFAGVLVFTGRPGWPAWYPVLWLPPVILAAWPMRRPRAIAAIALAAGAGATLMTWGAALAGRTSLAVRDLDGLGSVVDPLAEPMLAEFSSILLRPPIPRTAPDLYRRWEGSSLARQRYPVSLSLWGESGERIARVQVDELSVADSVVQRLAASAEEVGRPALARVDRMPGNHQLLAVRLEPGLVATVVLGPRSALVSPAPLGRVMVTGPERTALYRLLLAPAPVGVQAAPEGRWRREGWVLRLWRTVEFPDRPREVHALIPLGRPPWIYIRGLLIVLLDVLLVAALWLLVERAGGLRGPLPPLQVLSRSYRARLAITLAAFCLVPAVALAGLSLSQLGAEARRTRESVLLRILRDATPAEGLPEDPEQVTAMLADQRLRVRADLGVYRDGILEAATDPVLAALGALPPLLDPEAHHHIQLDGDLEVVPRSGPSAVSAAYAAVPVTGSISPAVLTTVAAASDRVVQERQTDVTALLLLATLAGIMAAVFGAGRAARTLSRPVTDLRDAAMAFGAGGEAGLPPGPPPEFAPVFEAFDRMARDVRSGQEALDAARRRLDAVLSTVTTGVVALDAQGCVLLANRPASVALGLSLPPGTDLRPLLSGPWEALARGLGSADGAATAGAGSVGPLELTSGDRRYVVESAPLGRGIGGLVLAINDVTESTRAARVLAWGEMANQVAHAIKNPLTPLRLGIQHLQRVQQTRPDRLPEVMEDTGSRVLAEIDRLDAIARAFSRFAAPAGPAAPLESVAVAEVVAEVSDLFRLAPDLAIRNAVEPGVLVPARRDELREVFLNLLDNARNAGASVVTIRAGDAYVEVSDNGRGIPPEALARVFEPRFSTTSSGSGLGLAIVKRLVEGWGGEVGITSTEGRRTTITISLHTETK